MKKSIIILILSVLSLLFAVQTVTAQDENSKDFTYRKIVTVRPGEVINKDYFAFGDTIEISGTVNGDVYAAGGQVLVDGTINGDLLAAGGTVSISGNISQDARIFGGQITISGEIGRNLTVGGGNIELTDSATIRGGIVAAGGNIRLAAPVWSDVKISAGNLTVSNKIDGNLKAFVGAIRLTSRAVITGDLIYWSNRPASIDKSAKITGNVTRKTPPGVFRPPVEKVLGVFVGVYLFATLISFISTLIIGLLLIHFYPKYNREAVSTLRKRPWASLGIGFIVLVLTPIIFVLLLATVVGIPLAFILLASYLITLYLVRIFVILWAGVGIFEWLGKTVHGGWALVVGLVVYSLLTLIPVIGDLVTFFVILFGLGAALLTKKELYSALRKQDII